MKKFAVVFALFVSLVLFLTLKNVYADDDCTQYGDCPSVSKSIMIDKLVGRNDTDFVDNFSTSDSRFSPGQELFFRLVVKNTSDVTLQNVELKDFVPEFLSVLEVIGSYDSTSAVMTFNAGNFEPNEEKTYTLKMKVVDQSELPSDKGLFCEVNKATANGDGVSDEDTSQFCIEKNVEAVTMVPSAGPHLGLALLSIEFAALTAGLVLKKLKK